MPNAIEQVNLNWEKKFNLISSNFCLKRTEYDKKTLVGIKHYCTKRHSCFQQKWAKISMYYSSFSSFKIFKMIYTKVSHKDFRYSRVNRICSTELEASKKQGILFTGSQITDFLNDKHLDIRKMKTEILSSSHDKICCRISRIIPLQGR